MSLIPLNLNPPSNSFCTGVGSRNTPVDVLQLMTQIGYCMTQLGIITRTGNAAGADAAFRNGAGALAHVYHPKQATDISKDIAGQFHPAWHYCKPYAKALHGRNSFQVLGAELADPSGWLICWTPDGCLHHDYRTRATGGTGTAISIASMYGVPHIYNLHNHTQFNYWVDWVNATRV